MIEIKKISENKPSILIHKGNFVLRKKAQKIIDTKSLIRYKELSVTPAKTFKRIRVKADFDDCDKADILNRSFFWLGMNGSPIADKEWCSDFLSGFTWKNKYFQDIVTVDLSTNADVKIPWELSRFQHLTRLTIIAQNEAKEEETAEIVRTEIRSWLSNNPYKMSVNWTCAMEVAIRAINWIFIALLIPEQLFCDKAFHNQFITSLYEHGKFIRQNLETYDENYNNHYLSDLLGLQWISLFCGAHFGSKERDEVSKWYKFAQGELESQCKKQIFLDGTDYESSIAYHRFVSELFFLSIYIDTIYEIKPRQVLLETVGKMATFLNIIRLPDGELPMIGDSDDGRILIFDDYSHWNKRSADFLLERKDQYLKGDFCVQKSKVPNPSINSVAYPDSGYYLLRNQRIYCLTHCGPLSLHGHGGHSHNDQLAVILAFNGESFVVDSGTGSYSGKPDLRNYFRSTAAHSTVEVDGHEQNDLIKESLYKMRERTFSKCLLFSDTIFSGEHSGYSSVGLTHRRNIELESDRIIIEDIITGNRDSNAKWCAHYILDSNVIVNQRNSKEFELYKNGISVILKSNSSLVVEKTIISKEYGKTEKSLKICTLPTNIENINTIFILGGNKVK